MDSRSFRRIPLVGGLLLAVVALAVSANNAYVTVGCGTSGVEDIVPVDDEEF